MKILFLLNQVWCGGIEKSALFQLDELAKSHDVTLLLDEPLGDLLPYVNKKVRIKYLAYSKDALHEKHWGRKKFLLWLLITFRIKKFVEMLSVYKKELHYSKERSNFLSKVRLYGLIDGYDDTFYDVAIGYSEVLQLYYLAEYVKAKKKVLWVHTQLDAKWCNLRHYLDYLKKMDEIVAVSDAIAKQIRTQLSEVANLVVVKKHNINVEAIRRFAADNWRFPDGQSNINIVTVGRLSNEKGFDLAIEAASLLRDSAVDFCWWFVGDGSERKKLERLVASYGLTKQVKFLGMQANPYPIMNSCDVYVQPSRYEGFGLTIAEAIALGKKVVSTKTAGAQEQITDREIGVLTEISGEGLKNGILEVLNEIH